MAVKWPIDSLITTDGDAVIYDGRPIGKVRATGQFYHDGTEQFWLSAGGRFCTEKRFAAYWTAVEFIRANER